MEKDELTYHVPVLLKESVDGMNIHPQNIEVADEAKPRYTVNALSGILNLIIK